MMTSKLILTAICVPLMLLGQRGLIEKALDEPTKINLENVKLSEAFRRVTEQTGVEVSLSPQAMALTPYGGETVVNARIANVSLRKGLTDLVSPLGMEFVVHENGVEVVPKSVLLCLGRPPTEGELDTLNELSKLQPGRSAADLESLKELVQLQVPVNEAWEVLASAIRNVGAGPGDEVLGVACENLGWTWCVHEGRLAVLTIEQQLRRQLRQTVSYRAQNRSLFDVMRRIGERVGVPVRVEPGALEVLPMQVQQHFSINVSQQTAEEAFDTIAAYTGLGYVIDPDGVLFYRAAAGPTPESPSGEPGQQGEGARGYDPYVGRISVDLGDGKTIDWLIRESELPPDLRNRRQQDLDQWFKALRDAG